MKRIISSIFTFLLIGSALFSGTVNAQDYIIIVNQSNTVSAMSQDQVSRLFLKKDTQWDDGKKVLPVDQVSNNKVRDNFSKEIHGKSVASIKAYWQKQIFSGRAVPPPEKSTDKDVIDYVKENPGAIGYISKSAIVDSVKVLKVKKQAMTTK